MTTITGVMNVMLRIDQQYERIDDYGVPVDFMYQSFSKFHLALQSLQDTKATYYLYGQCMPSSTTMDIIHNKQDLDLMTLLSRMDELEKSKEVLEHRRLRDEIKRLNNIVQDRLPISDWLEERGHDKAAQDLRENFTL